ncbi:MAG TPA: hypothetical protein VI895_13455 [Bdellovibrionota bacterium]|nr:hypothetical protein [Bdellovibrionota bacterium]
MRRRNSIGSLAASAIVVICGKTWAQEVEPQVTPTPSPIKASTPSTTTGGLYSKPFVVKFGKGSFLGGYFDTQFFNTFDTGSDKTFFDQTRFVPFIFGEIHPRLHLSAEIEFEHGGFVAGDPTEETDGEIKVEFVTLDFRMTDWLNFRGGLILDPLGRFNLVHDGPINELTDRPLVDRYVIPTTLSEAGVGFFGSFYPTEEAAMSYEIYVVNGFDGDTVNAAGTDLREGRGGAGSDNNRDKSMVSRVAYSPFLGLEVGGSVHTGAYSDNGEDWLTIGAVDVTYSRGAFELLGEYAKAWVEKGVNQQGLYGQLQYKFLHGLFSAVPDSHFTGVVRYDLATERSQPADTYTDRFTVGLNFRPIDETVFKIDYALFGVAANENGTGLDEGSQLAFSFATYF